jgi:hypothetical protein
MEGAWPCPTSLAGVQAFERSRVCGKLVGVVCLYVSPPAHAVVLSIDEKSQMQAFNRTQPGMPMKKGRAGTMTHYYKRNGTTTLFARSQHPHRRGLRPQYSAPQTSGVHSLPGSGFVTVLETRACLELPLSRSNTYLMERINGASLRFQGFRRHSCDVARIQHDYSINWAETTRHLTDVAATPGISAITVNGHASEVHACTVDEQREILDRALDDVGDRIPIIAGIFADCSHEAARLAKMSTDAGASALLVFPSSVLMMGGELRPEMAEAHFPAVADATDLPLICFNYARWTNLAYPA